MGPAKCVKNFGFKSQMNGSFGGHTRKWNNVAIKLDILDGWS